MNDYHVTMIDSREQWTSLSAPWNELLAGSRSATIFLTWEWLYSWGERYFAPDRTLFILTVYKDDELVGIAPWYIQQVRRGGLNVRQVQMLGSPDAGSDYLDVIMKKGHEQKVAVRLYEYLQQEARADWDCCMLQDLSSNSLFLVHVLDRIEEDGKYAEIRPASFCPIVMLPKKGEDVFSLYNSHRRLQYRRHLKLLKVEGDVRHDSFIGDDLHEALEAFFTLYESKNRNHDGTLRSFLTNYALRCGNQNVFQVDLLSSNAKLVAGLLHLKYRDTLSMYMMAVDREHHPHISLGNILVGMCLNNAIDAGFSVYDFLKGTEPYKFHWAEGGRSSVTLNLYQRKAAPLMLMAGTFLKYTAKTLLR